MEFEVIRRNLLQEYRFDVRDIKRMATGVGGDTYLVSTGQGKYVYKVADANAMNHPEAEPEICDFLLSKGIAVSEFLKNKAGNFATMLSDGRIGHVQKYVEGKTFGMNEATDWFMEQSPILLGKMHTVLREYRELPMGIGTDFFRYMTPESAVKSYRQSIEIFKQSMGGNKRSMEVETCKDENATFEDLEFRLKAVQKVSDWKFDLSKLTYANTHGDYTVNQIICGEDKINAVIDWTCACRHPVIWEITRSFFYADPSCTGGEYDENRFKDYVERYCSEASLTQYDREQLLKLYVYQLAVCDYYSQYLNAKAEKKDEYLEQARFATKVLRGFLGGKENEFFMWN